MLESEGRQMSESDKPRAKVAFHEIPMGTDVGCIEYEVSEDLARRHLEATHQSRYPTQGGLQLAPVSLVASDGIRLAEAQVDISESVHAGQRLEVINPPIVGSRVTVRGRLVDKFEKRGRQFAVIETVSEDDRGRLLARGRMVGVVRYRPEGEA
jgi:acyl dehydratase